MECLQDGAESRTVLVEKLEDEFGISQATAYRRLDTLEKELGYIVETDAGKMDLLIEYSQGVIKESAETSE
jgi:Fe2+ or Zn2+ uptake regulation protein